MHVVAFANVDDVPAPAALGTPDSATELLRGIRRVLSVEADAAEALGNHHGAGVLIYVLAEVLDGIDALGGEL